MKEISLRIEGMHCTGCSNRLERVLNNLDGVENAKVDFESKTAVISFNEGKNSIENIKEAIGDAGFKGE